MLDLFAGVGVGVAARDLLVGEWAVDNAKSVVAVREANGMDTELSDVWQGIDDPDLLPEHDILWASPPCQTFTMAGQGKGRKALDTVLQLIDERAFLRPGDMRAFGEETDPRTALVLSPMTYIHDHMPRAVILEQVPPVLPVWEAFVEPLTMMGYSVVTSLVHAEQYGVPQTRKRAILVARLDERAEIPAPTHSRYYNRDPKRLDPGVKPWVSMADALGWGMTERPYVAVAAGTEAGGTDPAALGGSGARKIVHGERDAGRWLTPEQAWATERPSTTIVGTFRPEIVAAPGYRTVGDPSRQDAPGSIRVTIEEAGLLQSFPPDFVWPEAVGKGAKFQVVGNAVPPLLARALIAEVMA